MIKKENSNSHTENTDPSFSQTLIPFGIIGLGGRMGQTLWTCAQDDAMFTCRGGYARVQPALGSVYASMSDVFKDNAYVVDFSNATLSQELAREALKHPKPLVVAITGLENPKGVFKNLAAQVPVVLCPNTSLGVYLQKQLSVLLSQVLPQTYDIDVIEKHHRFKKDAPSGTALDIAHAVAHARNGSCTLACASPRTQGTVPISALRAGQGPACNEVVFSGEGDTLSIHHMGFNKSIYAQGVLTVLKWLSTQKPKAGFYTMEDVFGFTLAQVPFCARENLT